MIKLLRWFGIRNDKDLELGDQFPYVNNMFCKLSVLELLSANQGMDKIIVPPFLHKNAGKAPRPGIFNENMAAYWPLVLHNSITFGVCELNEIQVGLLNSFEKTLQHLDNPWVPFLYNCGNEKVSFKIAISRQTSWTKNSLSIARQHYDDAVEQHIKRIIESYAFDRLHDSYQSL